MKRLFFLSITGIVYASLLAGCHVAGHLPPGQVKQVIDPPPEHGGVPPGRLKKK